MIIPSAAKTFFLILHFPRCTSSKRNTPNFAAAEAILRSAGLTILCHPEEETWICELKSNTPNRPYVVDQEFAGELIPDEGDPSRGGSGHAVE